MSERGFISMPLRRAIGVTLILTTMYVFHTDRSLIGNLGNSSYENTVCKALSMGEMKVKDNISKHRNGGRDFEAGAFECSKGTVIYARRINE